jgi:hypothetical protein
MYSKLNFILCIFLTLFIKNSKSVEPIPFYGTAYDLSFKNNHSTIYYQTDFDCSNVGGYPCHGITDARTTLYLNGPIRLNNNTTPIINKHITYTNNLTEIPDYPQVIDSAFNPYICQYYNYLDTTICDFDFGLPRIGSSYYDENNQLHMIGYVGNRCSQVNGLYKLRYLKYSTVTEPLYYSNKDSLTMPDKVLQFYDIETFDNQFEYQSDLIYYASSTLLLPTSDNQNLILYETPVLDTVVYVTDTTPYNHEYYRKKSINLLKLDENLNRTYNQQLFSAYFNDSTHLDYFIIKNKKINNRIYIEGNATKIINSFFDSNSSYSFLIELNAEGILMNEIIRPTDWDYSFIDSIENVNRGYEIQTTDTTTVINYLNASGEIIRTITFPEKLNHNLLKTGSDKYLFVSYAYNIYGNLDAYLNIYNENGRFIKKDLIVSGIWIDPGYINTAFLSIDTFKNVIFYYHQPTYTGGQACAYTFQKIMTGFQNLDLMNFVNGKILYNNQNNCQSDSGNLPVKNILLELKLNNKTYYTTSNDSGDFRINPSDTGHGKLIVHLEHQRFFVNACTDTFDVFISDTTENPFIEVLLQATPCKLPKVSVSMVTPFLRRCFDNNYTLSLTNETPDTIAAAYADVSLDDDLIPVDTAFNNALALGNNTYRFYFYDLLPFQTVRKHLVVNVNCATTLPGEAHCVKAVAFPYNSCVTADFPRLTASSECRNDSVLFLISRNALPDNYSVNYRILSDETITHTGTLNFTNTVNTQLLEFANPDGKTLRFESYQIAAYLNEDTVLSASVEGCGNDTFSIGYLTLFPPDDDVPFIDIDCQQNVGSFDPNEKAAQPNGYGDSSYILPNTALEYIIHFQNKGTFAASIVTIIDTLAASFDLTTFQFIASSHAFTYSIIDSNILQFNSINIYLPAEQDDTLGSMGFIKFSIKPKTTTPIGTTINNTAAILFDYNDAIITNTVNRTINDQFLKVSIVSNLKNNRLNIESKIFPNPFHQTSTLAFNYPRATTLTILSLDGKVLQQLQSTDNQYTISRNNNSNGMYIYELRDKESNELLDIGKLIIQ